MFGSLDGNYWVCPSPLPAPPLDAFARASAWLSSAVVQQVGTYGHDADGAPHFFGPRAAGGGATAAAPNGTLAGLGIWKTGGVGAGF